MTRPVIVASYPTDSSDGLPTRAAYAPTYYPGTAHSGEAQRVTVGAGVEQADITFQVLPLRAVRVTGRAVSSGGAPLSNGGFTISGLPGDARYLALDYVDESEARDPDFFERMKNLATPFALRDGERREVALGMVVRW